MHIHLRTTQTKMRKMSKIVCLTFVTGVFPPTWTEQNQGGSRTSRAKNITLNCFTLLLDNPHLLHVVGGLAAI